MFGLFFYVTVETLRLLTVPVSSAFFVLFLILPSSIKLHQIIMFHTCMCVAFTVLINGSLSSPFYKKLKLAQSDETWEQLDRAAVEHLHHAMDTFWSDECEPHASHSVDSAGTVSVFFAESKQAEAKYFGEKLTRSREGFEYKFGPNIEDIKRMLDINMKQDEKGNMLAPINGHGELDIKMPTFTDRNGKVFTGIPQVWAATVQKKVQEDWRYIKTTDGVQNRVQPSEFKQMHLSGLCAPVEEEVEMQVQGKKLKKTPTQRLVQ